MLTRLVGYFFGRHLCNRSIGMLIYPVSVKCVVGFSNAYGIEGMMLLANKPF